MDTNTKERTLKSTQEQAAAAGVHWLNEELQRKVDTMLAVQDANLENALAEMQELKKFVMSHTEDVLKNPRSFIRYPFIDPGSVYDGNVWDWDTYWSVYGFLNLADSYQDPSVKSRIIEHAQGNIRNFFDHQLEDGYIPMMIEVADWPEPYLNMRHKEGKIMNMHKPFLCSQMCLISDYSGDYAWTKEFLPGVAKYFDCYDHYYFHENSGLYVWQDDIMIGMDNDPATFGRPPFSTANIYLNSFMCVELEAGAKLYRQFGKEEEAKKLLEKRQALIEAIQQECWDKRDRFFYSVDVDIRTRKYDWFHQGLGGGKRCPPPARSPQCSPFPSPPPGCTASAPPPDCGK